MGASDEPKSRGLSDLTILECEELLDALKDARAIARDMPKQYRIFGICAAVARRFPLVDDENYEPLFDLYEGWPLHSGCREYPVRDVIGPSMWEGPNLQLRISLLDYSINRLEAIINAY